MPSPQPEPPRIEPVLLPELQDVSVPPARSDIRELERYAGVDLTDADLRFASLTECELSGLQLSGSRWDGTRLRQVQLTDLDAAALSAPRGDWREVEIAGCRLELVGGGHMLPVTQPELTARFIERAAAGR